MTETEKGQDDNYDPDLEDDQDGGDE